jgi:membrane protein DedA with SNARE-associated domain
VSIGVRFAYGLRIAGPILIGTSRISTARFMAFNAVGALLWAILVAGTGFLFGEAAQAILGDLRGIEIWLLLALFAGAVLFLLIQRARSKTRR